MINYDIIVYIRIDPKIWENGKEDITQIFDTENAYYDPLQYILFHSHGKDWIP